MSQGSGPGGPEPRFGGARAMVETLQQAGIRHVFGIPGSTEAPILEELRRHDGIAYVLGLHEGVVVAMAEGYARATGRPSVVMLHTSVGSFNAAGQLYNALRNSAPVVALAGHKDRTVLAEDGFCATDDLAGAMSEVVKWSRQSLTARQVAGDVARALHIAGTQPAGPTFLTVPVDLLVEDIGDEASVPAPKVHQLVRQSRPSPEGLRAVLALLADSHRPVMVLGNRAAGARSELRALSDVTGIPVAAAPGHDLTVFPFPMTDERFIGTYQPGQEPFASADLVLAVGCRTFYPYSERQWPRLPPGASLVHIDCDPVELGWGEDTAIGLLGDIGGMVGALAELAGTGAAAGASDGTGPGLRHHLERRDQLRIEYRKRVDALQSTEVGSSGGSPMGIDELTGALRRVLPGDAVVVEEAVRSSRRLLQGLDLGEDQVLWLNRGGALGWGVPAAVGAQLAWPGRPVVAVVGDGSFHFAVQGLWTAVQQGAPVVVVVLDNGGYLAVKRHIEQILGVDHDLRRHPGTVIEGIDHAAVAAGYGAHGVTVRSPSELGDEVRAALGRQGVSVVVAPIQEVRP